ncbi:MAG: hypothetical protein JNM93_05415 [Bacteriovoracaceae bacterium]|nr:hypothetical protein [Bacteriovoracaceae bacterium]
MPFLFVKILSLLFCTSLFAAEVQREQATFSGRISRINDKAQLMRVKVDFENAKFLTKKDRVEFWNDNNPSKRCSSYIEATSNEYLLLKVPQYATCVHLVHLTTGSYLHFYSPDLERNLNVARDVLDILLKKRMAIEARLQRDQKRLDTYPDRVETINHRYEILRQKLDLERQEELQAMEEDKAYIFKNYQSAKIRLDEIEHKLQQYKIGDQNYKLDRWSLDPKLYQKK